MLRLVTIICLFISAHAYATEVYRSVDEYGRPVYSNTPPEGQDHQVVDVEIQNDLGTRVQPSADSKYFRFQPSTPDVKVRKTHTGSYSKNRSKNLDMSDLQAKCESYRNAGKNNEYHRKQRDYWCSRLHRGK